MRLKKRGVRIARLHHWNITIGRRATDCFYTTAAVRSPQSFSHKAYASAEGPESRHDPVIVVLDHGYFGIGFNKGVVC